MLGPRPWKLSYPLCRARIEITVCDPELGPPKPNCANRLLLNFLSLEPWKMSFVAFNPPVYAVRADSRLVSLHSLFSFNQNSPCAWQKWSSLEAFQGSDGKGGAFLQFSKWVWSLIPPTPSLFTSQRECAHFSNHSTRRVERNDRN